MTAGDLIAKLQRVAPDALVFLHCGGDDYYSKEAECADAERFDYSDHVAAIVVLSDGPFENEALPFMGRANRSAL